MKRSTLYTLLVIGVLAVGWYYAPQEWRDRAKAFIGLAVDLGVKEGGKLAESALDAIVPKVVPENPVKKREVAIRELKKNLTALKENKAIAPLLRGSGDAPQATSTSRASVRVSGGGQSASVSEIITQSEKLIQEIETLNAKPTITETITNRVVETVVSKKEVEACKVETK